MMKRLVVICLVALSTASWADDRCTRSAEAQTAVRISLSATAPLSQNQFEARFEVDNKGKSDVWLDLFTQEGKPFISDAQVQFQFPDVNGQWVTWITAPGTFIGGKSPTRLRAGSSEQLYVWLPPNELFQNFHGKARMLLRLAKSGNCVASEPFQAVIEQGQVKAFKNSW